MSLFLIHIGVEIPGHQEDQPRGDRDGVVGDPLVVPAEQGDIHSSLDTVFPVRLEQFSEGLATKFVDLLVDLVEFAR